MNNLELKTVILLVAVASFLVLPITYILYGIGFDQGYNKAYRQQKQVMDDCKQKLNMEVNDYSISIYYRLPKEAIDYTLYVTYIEAKAFECIFPTIPRTEY